MDIDVIHARVVGRVQGVGFRYATARVAREARLTGWVRNDTDGSVEVWAQGDRDAVERLVRFLRVGPMAAEVDAVTVTSGVANPSLSGFTVRA